MEYYKCPKCGKQVQIFEEKQIFRDGSIIQWDAMCLDQARCRWHIIAPRKEVERALREDGPGGGK